jgi:hypothetical protein
MRTDGIVTAEVVMGQRYAQDSQRAAFYDQLEQDWNGCQASNPWRSPTLCRQAACHGRSHVALTVAGGPPWKTPRPASSVACSHAWLFPHLRHTHSAGPGVHRGGSPPDRAVHDNQPLLRTDLFRDENPLGQKIARSPASAPNSPNWYTIVGVAADTRNTGLTDRNDRVYLVRRRGSSEYQDARRPPP